MSIQRGIPIISEPYRPPQPDTGIALLLHTDRIITLKQILKKENMRVRNEFSWLGWGSVPGDYEYGNNASVTATHLPPPSAPANTAPLPREQMRTRQYLRLITFYPIHLLGLTGGYLTFVQACGVCANLHGRKYLMCTYGYSRNRQVF
jgi:hypothetical protein